MFEVSEWNQECVDLAFYSLHQCEAECSQSGTCGVSVRLSSHTDPVSKAAYNVLYTEPLKDYNAYGYRT